MPTANSANFESESGPVTANQNDAFSSLWHGVFAVGCLFVFYSFRDLTHDVSASGISGLLSLTFLTAVTGFLGRAIRYDHFAPFFSSLTRMTAAGVAVYILAEPPDFTLANAESQSLHRWVMYMYLPAFLASVAALWRPSFLLFPAAYLMATRAVVSEISGYRISTLDIIYLMEMAQFLSLTAVLLGTLGIASRDHLRLAKLPPLDLTLLATCAGFIAIGMHLGNYFWSGVEKVVLGPDLWSWAVHNPTYTSIINAIHGGRLPTGTLDWLNVSAYDSFSQTYQISNAVVVITQLAAVVAILRLSWMKIISVAYDLLHIGIYVFGGLFFWPWIWNNLTILIALRRSSDAETGMLPKVCCIITVFLGVSPELGNSARLAWWDTQDSRLIEIQAQTSTDDAWISVPMSYFLSHSYSMSHGYMGWAEIDGHYTAFSSRDMNRAVNSGACVAPAPVTNPESPEARERRLARFDTFIQAHHDKMLARENELLPNWYYYRSHHHPSNPFQYKAFNALQPSDITAYRLVIKSVCLKFEGNSIHETMLKQTNEVFPVR